MDALSRTGGTALLGGRRLFRACRKPGLHPGEALLVDRHASGLASRLLGARALAIRLGGDCPQDLGQCEFTGGEQRRRDLGERADVECTPRTLARLLSETATSACPGPRLFSLMTIERSYKDRARPGSVAWRTLARL